MYTATGKGRLQELLSVFSILQRNVLLSLLTGIQGTGDQTRVDHAFSAACVFGCAFERTKWMYQAETNMWKLLGREATL